MTAPAHPHTQGHDAHDGADLCAHEGWVAWWRLALLWLDRFADCLVHREAMWDVRADGHPDAPPTSPWLAYLEVAPHLPARERRMWLRECLLCLTCTRGHHTWVRGMRRGGLWAWSRRGVSAAWWRLIRVYLYGISRGRLARAALPVAFRVCLPDNADPPAGGTAIAAAAPE